MVNGCSYTYGDELPSPETQRWGYHLAKSLDVPLTCLAEGGSSNYKIYRDTMEFLQTFNTEDITYLIVMWSAFERVEVFDKEYNCDNSLPMIQMSPVRTKSKNKHIRKHKDSWESFYTELYNTHTGVIHTLSNMSNLAWLCHRLNIKLIQTWFHPHCIRTIDGIINRRPRSESEKKMKDYTRKIINFLPDKSKIGFLDSNLTFDDFTITNNYKICPDGHPGIEAHEAFGKYLGGIL